MKSVHVLALAAATSVFASGGAASPNEDLTSKFRDFDQDNDGIVEIRSVEEITNAGGGPQRVLVLVEPRLLTPLEGAEDLVPLIEQFVADLGSEGYRAESLAVELGESDLHQDGRFVLAIRQLLREADRQGKLAGAVLVGRFPDALIVRTCNWRKEGPVTLHKGTEAEFTSETGEYLRRVPEVVARRSDIVLSDLDGNWEDIYVQPRTRLDTIYAVFENGVPPTGGPCLDFERDTVTFEDFFHVSDGKLEISEYLGPDGKVAGPWLALFDRSGDHECSDSDRQRPNILARPDIIVSRIDARGTAQRTKPGIAGADGEGLLDGGGNPRAVQFAAEDQVPHWRDAIWEADPVLERRLLAEYFRRNHAFRSGACEIAWRPSSIACDLGSGYEVMRRAANDWDDSQAGPSDVHGRPTLVQFVDWLQYGAILRTIRAHSDPWGSVFQSGGAEALDERLGGPAWSWTPRGRELVPSLAAACGGGKLDWFLLHSLWRYGLPAHQPAFYVHTGCDGISPPGSMELPFDDPGYGVRQGAEAILFFANGLALVGRSKVFYDEPRGFAEALAEGATFGEAWARYFQIESRAASWNEAGGDIGRKRSYFWSVLGDWTLRLKANR